MALNIIDGQSSANDLSAQRVGFGTMGGDHVVPRGLGGKTINSIVDDQDSRVSFVKVRGITTGSDPFGYSVFRQSSFDSTGTFTQLGKFTGFIPQGALFNFTGTSIGVLGQYGTVGSIRVYIDGIETKGKLPVFNQLSAFWYSGANNNTLNPTDTRIYLGSTTGLPATNGAICIEREVITYATLVPAGTDPAYLDGCTRGAFNSTATTHPSTSTVYLWDSRVNLSSGSDFGTRKVLWINHLLDNGPHQIVVAVTDDNNIGGNNYFNFDGFLTGPLIGQGSMSIEYGTVTLSSSAFGNTNANGYVYLNALQTRGEVAIVGTIGINQLSPSPNGSNMFKLGVNSIGNGVEFYLANGPANSAWTVQILFAYIGENY